MITYLELLKNKGEKDKHYEQVLNLVDLYHITMRDKINESTKIMITRSLKMGNTIRSTINPNYDGDLALLCPIAPTRAVGGKKKIKPKTVKPKSAKPKTVKPKTAKQKKKKKVVA